MPSGTKAPRVPPPAWSRVVALILLAWRTEGDLALVVSDVTVSDLDGVRSTGSDGEAVGADNGTLAVARKGEAILGVDVLLAQTTCLHPAPSKNRARASERAAEAAKKITGAPPEPRSGDRKNSPLEPRFLELGSARQPPAQEWRETARAVASATTAGTQSKG